MKFRPQIISKKIVEFFNGIKIFLPRENVLIFIIFLKKVFFSIDNYKILNNFSWL